LTEYDDVDHAYALDVLDDRDRPGARRRRWDRNGAVAPDEVDVAERNPGSAQRIG